VCVAFRSFRVSTTIIVDDTEIDDLYGAGDVVTSQLNSFGCAAVSQETKRGKVGVLLQIAYGSPEDCLSMPSIVLRLTPGEDVDDGWPDVNSSSRRLIMGLTQIIRRYEQQLEPGELNADQPM
jgi:hypothetical protein